jgi:DHA1 family bicyclomycin/chloramphenicol resistance-like MFS transporter
MIVRKPLKQTEFVALIATLTATIAFSIDAMLPAMPQIAAELSPGNPNAAQLVVTSFVLGMGIGTIFVGPLSDAFGRKPVILGGLLLYALCSMIAWTAPSLELLLAARVLQGLGVAAPRIVCMAMVRDLYSGRAMARIMSFAMMVFMLMPAIAPALGAFLIAFAGWRSLFVAFLLFAAIGMIWLGFRQPETLASGVRRPLALGTMWDALKEVLSHRVILVSTAVMALVFGMLFATISSIQPIFDQTFDKAESFPLWFAFIAVCAGLASFLNAQLVTRFGMRVLVTTALCIQVLLSAIFAGTVAFAIFPDFLQFPTFLLWAVGVFTMISLTSGNLTAMAMEPAGHIAGMVASMTGAISTIFAVLLAIPLGLAFDGTPVPLMFGVSVLSAVGVFLMWSLPVQRTA